MYKENVTFCRKDVIMQNYINEKCPVCGKDVVRTRFGYGCTGYKDGCKFSINGVICQRVISLSNVKKLLETGKTYKIENFVSKNGKNFSGYLKLENGRAVFDFND